MSVHRERKPTTNSHLTQPSTKTEKLARLGQTVCLFFLKYNPIKIFSPFIYLRKRVRHILSLSWVDPVLFVSCSFTCESPTCRLPNAVNQVPMLGPACYVLNPAHEKFVSSLLFTSSSKSILVNDTLSDGSTDIGYHT